MIDLIQSALWLIAVVALVATDIFDRSRIRRLEQRVSELTRSRRSGDA
jgi:hypothetical protein